ncbi:amidase [Micromonospora endophytica]|uniref:Amidase n=1 Tax=Micromonospora endophytica TaxID=515350 RepID=A0A2W2CHJ5_9ACTN|nr:amidase [Micromonospora endophytica]PZF98032.1 amidase [Micromonospora endophytica]RIW49841.1 amidase [Micromonospora endophytica]BCJ57226.1 6-aminohexanoate-cyclic-dimer hydrolase [Micromonospora endophytica]
MSGLMDRDAHEQARLVREGEVSAEELVAAAIDTIEQRDGEVNAVVHKRYEQALDEARRITGSTDGPFAGVPTLVKSMDALAGAPAHLGSVYLAGRGRTAAEDSPVVRRLRQAGFIVLGQTAAPEFGLVSVSETKLHGVTRNPWDLTRTPGGSSGGASAVVSAGMVAVGQGGDGGGSIRMPAAFCHLVGLKPSHGLLPGRIEKGDRWGHSVPAVVTRSVRDTAAVVEFLADRANRSPRLPAFRHGDLSDAVVGRDPRPLRIGYVAQAPAYAPQVVDSVRDAVASMAGLMESLGHRVEEAHPVDLFDPHVLSAFFDTLSVTVAQSVDQLTAEVGAAPGPDDLDPITRFWEERGRQLSAVELADELSWQQGYKVRMAGWWQSFDLLLSPVFSTPAPEVGWPWREPGGIKKSVDVLTFTAPFNTTGQPAISVPAAVTDNGLPLGVQFVADFGREDLLLRVAHQVETARPWNSIAPRLR